METKGSPDEARRQLDALLEEDPADLYENAPCGYLSTTARRHDRQGQRDPLRVDRTADRGRRRRPVPGPAQRRRADLPRDALRAAAAHAGGGPGDRRSTSLRVDGSVLPCLLNAVEVRDDRGRAVLVRATLFDATARRRYERELLTARRTAEESEQRSRALHRIVSALARRAHRRRDRRGRARAGAAGGTGPGVGAGAARRGPGGRGPAADRRPIARHRRRPAGGAADGGARPADPGAGPGCAGGAAGRTAADGAAGGGRRDGVGPARRPRRRTGVRRQPVPRRAGARCWGPRPAGSSTWGTGRSSSSPLTGRCWPRSAGRPARRWSGRGCTSETARQADRAAFLLEAARLMAAADDVKETVDRLAELAVQRLADVCVIDLMTEHGMTRPAARHGDPSRQHLVDELRDRHLSPPTVHHPSVRRGGRGPHAVGAGARRRDARPDHHRAAACAGGPRARAGEHGRACRCRPAGGRWGRSRWPPTCAAGRSPPRTSRWPSSWRCRCRRWWTRRSATSSRRARRTRCRPACCRRRHRPCPACRWRSVTSRPRGAWRSAATSTTWPRCPVARWRWPSATWSATTSPRRRRWGSCGRCTGRCWWSGRSRRR